MDARLSLSTSSIYRHIVFVSIVFFAAITVGALRYRGPQPLGADADAKVPSAARMRETLEGLLGDPPQTHSVGTTSGDAFLDALELRIQSFGVATNRVVIPLDRERHGRHRKNLADLLDQGTPLKNLIATIPGRHPNWKPILVATHHDSCRWGPGAGDAGVPVAALVENLRILAENPPNRTTHFLFTDGEEYGLLGAYALADQDELPFDRPAFVLNYDARGTSGGVPMFETHNGNAVWVEQLIGHLADPKITSSLAVTVYRTLPNATDFNVWKGELGLSGFNFATIGSAHRYHQPSDVPENVSDRTIQHMGDHLHQMQLALDVIDDQQMNALMEASKNGRAGNAVFFDVMGYSVVHFSETVQTVFGVVAFTLCGWLVWKCRTRMSRRSILIMLKQGISAVFVAAAFGGAVQAVLYTTPWGNLRYTPVDYAAGLITIVAAFICATMMLVHQAKKEPSADSVLISDGFYFCISTTGLILSLVLPGGAYLLVLPSLTYATIRVSTKSEILPSWLGWVILSILVGPILVLLVQALGPWKQPLYAALSGLWALFAMQVWYRLFDRHSRKQFETE